MKQYTIEQKRNAVTRWFMEGFIESRYGTEELFELFRDGLKGTKDMTDAEIEQLFEDEVKVLVGDKEDDLDNYCDV